MLEILIVIAAVVAVGFLIVKKVDAAAALFAVGVLLLVFAAALGHTGTGALKLKPSGNVFYDQLNFITAIFSNRFATTGLIIMMLFGFASYMTHIGANDKAVEILTKPLLGLKLKYLLVPVVFWVGSLLSLVVPSASSLAILLMATLYPAMVGAGISRLSSGAVIATTATIMPTPLGADNVVAAERLGYQLGDYVFGVHAKVSIPTLLIMGIAHYFWQKYMDGRALRRGLGQPDQSAGADVLGVPEAAVRKVPAYYAILPVLPLIFVLVPFLLETLGISSFKFALLPITIISLFIGVLVEIIRRRMLYDAVGDIKVFFRGMGDGAASVVALLIAAGIFVEAITQLGVIDSLVKSVEGVSGAGFILMLVFVGATILLVLLTGSGLAPFYSFIEVIPRIATQTGINGVLLALPIQFVGNLARAMSPVSAVVLIVAGAMKVQVTELVKRTVVPMGVGIVSSIALTWILF